MTKILFIALLAVAVFLYFRATAGAGTNDVWKSIGEGALVIDVRSAEEFASGHLDGALNVVHTETEALAQAIGDDKSRSVVLYCRSGNRSGRALNSLQERGYTNVINGGGFSALRDAKPAAP